MSRINMSAPIDPTDRFAQRVQSLEAQVAELQLATSRVVPWRYVGAASQPAFLNSWVNLDATGAVWERASFRKVGDLVYIRGAVTGGVPPTSVFTLPAGFRPPSDLIFAEIAATASGLGRLDVRDDGTVIALSAGGGGFYSLNCVFSVSA